MESPVSVLRKREAVSLALVQWPFVGWLFLVPIKGSGYQFGLSAPTGSFLCETASLVVGGALLVVRLIVVRRVRGDKRLAPGVLTASFFAAVFVALLSMVVLFRSDAVCHDDSRNRSATVESFASLVVHAASNGVPGTAMSGRRAVAVPACGALR